MLGRVKLVRDAVAQGRALSLDAVMQLDNRRQMDNEGYAWCWAAAKWLDAHPRYRDRFRRLYKNVKEPDFNRRMREIYADDWSDLAVEWQAYVRMLDHNYDFEQTAIWFLGGFPLKSGGANLQLRADRGWQSSGARLEAGRTYRIRAGGRYEIVREVSDDREQVWWSEPGGVTIEYHDGFPLGMLLGAIDARTADGRAASEKGTESVGFAHPFAVGLQKTITPAAGGTLYLRVNDSGGRLDDNRGGLAVMIEAVDAAGDDARSRETP